MDRSDIFLTPRPAGVSLIDLHARVVNGDRAALEVIAEQAVSGLYRHLRCAFRRADADVLQDAVDDALMDYARCPERFDASSDEALDRCLYRAAWRNVANSLRDDVRRRKQNAQYVREVILQNSRTTVSRYGVRIDADMTRVLLDLAIDDAERKALACWLRHPCQTAPLAHALGMGMLPIAEQRRAVKRFKDRILRRIARLATATDRLR
jgi:RNA polymerase sigma-70 factor (ECF subfamily)